MSIYSTRLSLDSDDHDDCARWVKQDGPPDHERRAEGRRSVASAVAALDELGNYGANGNDPETIHMEADKILRDCVDTEIEAAWLRLEDRTGFWYA